MREKLIEILERMTEVETIAVILWCHDRNMKVSSVAHCLWERECRDQGKWA